MLPDQTPDPDPAQVAFTRGIPGKGQSYSVGDPTAALVCACDRTLKVITVRAYGRNYFRCVDCGYLCT